MQAEYRDRLSPNVRALVQETERAGGVEITVVVDPERARGLPGEPDPLACQVDAHGAQLLITDPAHLPDASVLHEVLHIRRFLLDSIPRIVVCEEFEPWTPEFETALTRVDNSLEHLVIVPEELQAYPERRARWEAVMHRVVHDLADEQLSDDDRRRWALIVHVFIQHVTPNEELAQKAAALLQSLAATEQAAAFCAALLPVLASKEQVVKTCFQHLQIPTEAGCLQYFDSHTGTSRIVSIGDAG